MITKAYPWAKIFLVSGLLLVAVNGIWLDPRVRDHFISVEDTEDQGLRSVSEAHLKIQSRLEIFRDHVDDLSLLQKMVHGNPVPEDKQLKGLPFPLSGLGAGLFPNLSIKLELRLAKKELVNIERKMERLEVICDSIEREAISNHQEDKAKPLLSKFRQVMPLEQIKLLRQQLLIDKANLKDLAEALNKLEQSYAQGSQQSLNNNL